MKKKRRFPLVPVVLSGLTVTAAAVCATFFLSGREGEGSEELLVKYMNCIPRKEYGKMYEMTDLGAGGEEEKEAFIKRNQAIYEGMEADEVDIKAGEYDKRGKTLEYHMVLHTAAGEIGFDNKASFVKEKDGYRIVWEDSLIFPELGAEDKVKVSVTKAERGEIYDRNGRLLAGKGTAVSVGAVPGKLKDRDVAAARLSELLDMDEEAVSRKLEAKWVKEDSFVPLKTVPKAEELELMSDNPPEETLKEKQRQEKLFEIPGVMLSDTEVRSYPLGESAAHLIGYVQAVTAEDLEEHPGEGYTSSSVIGRSGMEGLYEKELKGKNGYRIYIVDKEGDEKSELISTVVEHGKNITLTIDAGLQSSLYEEFREDKSCSVAMNQYTGEVLALVSTPSFDNNDFIMGMSDEMWGALNEDEKKPLYNRFRQAWCPGSTFKPVTAAIGLASGAIDPEEDYGMDGLSWQKDASWGSYYVTTLHGYQNAVLENAMIHSDNIYFAKAALKIGADSLSEGLDRLGFGEEVPFEVKMAKSQYSNSEKIETEIQLADSGYGQGQILVNPLHLACIYTAFSNEGSMIKPYLLYQEEARAEYWIEGAFPKEVTDRVLETMEQVVNHPDGTGYRAHRSDLALAGKTGTAELKASKDVEGTELGWFAVFTEDRDSEKPVLIISMVDGVQKAGGSNYVVNKDKAVLDACW